MEQFAESCKVEYLMLLRVWGNFGKHTRKDPFAAGVVFRVRALGWQTRAYILALWLSDMCPSVSHLSSLTLPWSQGEIHHHLVSASLWSLNAVSEPWHGVGAKEMDILLCFPISCRARFFHSMFLPLSQFCTLPSSNGFQCERDILSPPLLLCHPTSHPCSESGSLLGSGPTPPRACWYFHLDALPSHQIPHLFNLRLNLPLHPQSWFSFLVFVSFFQPS